jgi:hypothetical protein
LFPRIEGGGGVCSLSLIASCLTGFLLLIFVVLLHGQSWHGLLGLEMDSHLIFSRSSTIYKK